MASLWSPKCTQTLRTFSEVECASMGGAVSGNYLRTASTILSFARHTKKTLSTLNWDIGLVQIVLLQVSDMSLLTSLQH